MFRLKEKLSVFRNFVEQWKFFIEDLTFLHCSAIEWTDIFVQLSLDITFHAIVGWGSKFRTTECRTADMSKIQTFEY